MKSANIINHFGLVLDSSSSMTRHRANLVKVADDQIAHWALRSKELEQETRVSVWTFAGPGQIECVVWDMDVLRLPSIQKFYQPSGNTALIDATLKSISDLSETPERYGDHSFLVFVLTDGQENQSINTSGVLGARILSLANNWTLAALVPDSSGKHEAKRFGFPAGNIEIWDANSQRGVAEAGERIRAATETYMVNRTMGTRSTRTLFSTDVTAVNADTINQAGMVPLARNKYMISHVPADMSIREFTEQCGQSYSAGRGFYELMKTETIQPNKQIAVVERAPTRNVFIGGEARAMLGLRDQVERVKPSHNPLYQVFVQSNAVNRKLIAHTDYLYLI